MADISPVLFLVDELRKQCPKCVFIVQNWKLVIYINGIRSAFLSIEDSNFELRFIEGKIIRFIMADPTSIDQICAKLNKVIE